MQERQRNAARARKKDPKGEEKAEKKVSHLIN
jgi:hypothetical protein